MSLQPGTTAPDFALYDTERNKITLSSLKGENVLLLFFPLAFTSVCTKELCSVRDNIALYNNAHAKVFGISVDSTATLARFKAEQQLNFPLLSDFNREAVTAYGCAYESFGSMGMQGVAKRSSFVIDRDGIIRYSEVLDNAGDFPDFEGINAILGSLA